MSTRIRRLKHEYFAIVFLCCIAIFALQSISAAQPPPPRVLLPLPPQTENWQPILYTIILNHRPTHTIARCYRDRRHTLWVSADDLHRWGLKIPPHPPHYIKHKPYYQLTWYPGLHYSVDSYALQLMIDVPPEWLPMTYIGTSADLYLVHPLRPTEPGFFLNYDVYAQHNDVTHDSHASGLTELGLFNQAGVGISDFLWQSDSIHGQHAVTRLTTTWTLDQPEQIATWRFGDAITSNSDWSGAVRFAGIQYATNFNTQPNLVTFPLPSVNGEAIVPTSLSIFVNHVLQQTTGLNPGPYSINNIPVITGQGTLHIVANDMLGQERVLELPYYASNALLRPGLSDFSFEAGAVRKNYGYRSFDYGRLLAVGTYERGMTPDLTLGGHAELLADEQTVGMTAYYLWDHYGVFTFALAGSQHDQTVGGLAEFGFRHQGRHISFGYRLIATTHQFVQLGVLPYHHAPRLTAQAFVGLNYPVFGSFSLSYTRLENRPLDRRLSIDLPLTPRSELVSLSYSRPMFHRAYLNVSGLVDLQDHHHNQALVQLIWTLGDEHLFSAGVTKQYDHTQYVAQYSKDPPFGNGWGYDLLASNDDDGHIEGRVTWQNPANIMTAHYAHIDHYNQGNISIHGRLLQFAHATLLTRPSEQSFAVVEVPGFPGVRVYYRHELVGRTNRHGILFIPDLLPYQLNDIRINPRDLPLDADIHTIKHQVIPYFRSGVHVVFAVQHSRAVLIHLQLPHHRVVPAGAIVTLQDTPDRTYPVGYHGAVYLSHLNRYEIHGEAIWLDQRCQFELVLPPTSRTPIIQGSIQCHPMPPVNK